MSYNRYPAAGGGGGAATSITIDSTTVTGGTAGSVLFISSTGKVSQDNAAFFWDRSNKRLGIGTAAPSTALHVSSGSITCPGAGTNSERFGSGAVAAGVNGLAIGKNATAPWTNSTVIGTSAGISGSDNGGFLVAVGSSARAFSTGVAIGAGCNVSAPYGVGIGWGVTSSGSGSVAICSNSLASGANSFAFGRNSSVAGNSSVTIGISVANSDDFTFRYSLGDSSLGLAAPSFVMGGVTATTADVDMFRVITSWVDNTFATRKSRITFNAYDDTAAREGLRLEANGTDPMLGFYGASAVACQVLATGAGASVDDVITVLQNLGLCKQS